MAEMREHGPWSVRIENRDAYIESDDFGFDVTLSLTGDFTSETRLAYANKIAEILNASTPFDFATHPNTARE